MVDQLGGLRRWKTLYLDSTPTMDKVCITSVATKPHRNGSLEVYSFFYQQTNNFINFIKEITALGKEKKKKEFTGSQVRNYTELLVCSTHSHTSVEPTRKLKPDEIKSSQVIEYLCGFIM